MSTAPKAQHPEISSYAIALREELRAGTMRSLGKADLGDLDLELCSGRDSVWLIVRRPGHGGLALRAAHVPVAGFTCRKLEPREGEALRFEVDSAFGRHAIAVSASSSGLHRLRLRTSLTPQRDLLLPYIPRDLYPLGAGDDPLRAEGNVEAAQRGLNAGLVYFRLDRPAFGSVLYFQNFTVLDRYFELTGTKPDGVVGGEWPELGYAPPTAMQDESEEGALPAGEEVLLSDAIVVVRDDAGDDEQEMARQFVPMLGTAYRALERPPVEFRDWPWRAERTLADLVGDKRATVTHRGCRFVMPYVEGEVPDSMVQLTVLASLHDYGKWRGEPVPLEAELRKGLELFHDPKRETLMRFVPGLEGGKDPGEVDSWYLYHPLINLARLALDGDEEARRLLLGSVGFGVRAAHHFDYRWPILYRIEDFSVDTATRGDERFGQTDVNGLYAYLMLQLHQLTGESRWIDEARASLEAARGLRFDLLYQANLSVWGAVACLRLWRITLDPVWLQQNYVYVAALLHNCEIWSSRIGHARHYDNFLGATALHDSPYMAMYECFECFAGFQEYLDQGGPELDPAARMLVGEFCKYALDRAWHYFPDTLPAEAVHQGEHQSGKVDRKLSFPLEDLYGDGQEAGQIGQEIYGCGAPFVFTAAAFRRIEDAPFLLFCNHALRGFERTGHRALRLELGGGETCKALVSVIRRKRRKLPRVTLAPASGEALEPASASPDRIDFEVPASGGLTLGW